MANYKVAIILGSLRQDSLNRKITGKPRTTQRRDRDRTGKCGRPANVRLQGRSR
jgi:hypothetical protein